MPDLESNRKPRISKSVTASSENISRALIELIGCADDEFIWVIDRDLRLTWASPSVESILGFTVKESLQLPFAIYIPSADDFIRDELLSLLQQQEAVEPHSWKFAGEQRRKDGTLIHTELRLSLMRDEENRPSGALGITRDISDHLKAEIALRESEGEFRSLVEHLPAVSYIDSPDGKLTIYISPQVESMLGYTTEEWLADPSLANSIIHPDDLTRVQECIETDNFPIDHRAYARDGRLLWLHVDRISVSDFDGKYMCKIGYCLDITEQKLNEDHENTIRRLQEREQVKTDFLSLVSHQLRTPITPIRGAIDMLLGGFTGPITAQQQKLLEMADRHTCRLQRLVTDLLDIFHLENGRLELHLAPVNLQEIVQETRNDHAEKFQAKGLSLDFETSSNIPIIQGDAKRLEQVMDNLLNNAYKFTEQGGVKMRLARNDKHLILQVSDTGIGIPEDQTDKIFKRFFQVDGFQEGAGLGLAIVKHLVEAHQGSIEFESVFGEGRTFTINLPV